MGTALRKVIPQTFLHWRLLTIKELGISERRISTMFSRPHFECFRFMYLYLHWFTLRLSPCQSKIASPCIYICTSLTMSNRYCLSLYLYLTHRVEDVLPLLTSFLTHSMICCQLRVRVRQQHHLTSRDFVWFITQVCPATSYNLLGPTQHHMPSEICKIPSMKVILIFVHTDHIFKVGKFVFHFDTENWEEQLKKTTL